MAKPKKNDVVNEIAKLYSNQAVLTHAPEADRNLAGHVAQQVNDGKRVRSTVADLVDLRDRLQAYADATTTTTTEEQVEQVVCKTKGCETVLDADRIQECKKNGWPLECDACSWGDTPDKLAKDKTAASQKAAQDKAEAERKAAAAANGKKKDSTPGRSRSALSPEGQKIVGEGLAFTGTVKQVTYQGTLLPTCEVVIQGVTYSSPFNAVNKLSGTRYNGWSIFKFEDADGNTKPLDVLRNGSMGYADRKTGGSRRSPLEKAQAEVAKIQAQFDKAAAKAADLETKLAAAKDVLCTRQAEVASKPKVEA